MLYFLRYYCTLLLQTSASITLANYETNYSANALALLELATGFDVDGPLYSSLIGINLSPF